MTLLALPIVAVALQNLSTVDEAASGIFAQAHAEEAAKGFHGVGVITGIDSESGFVTIDHEAIPGFMDAMEMAYQLKSPAIGAGLKKGDRVEFDVDGMTSTVVAIRKKRV